MKGTMCWRGSVFALLFGLRASEDAAAARK